MRWLTSLRSAGQVGGIIKADCLRHVIKHQDPERTAQVRTVHRVPLCAVFRTPENLLSPDKTKRELDIAIVGYRLRNCSELSRVKGPIRNLKLRRVHDVEELRTELQFPFSFSIKRDVFEHGKVEVGERRTCPDISTCVPECETIRYAESCGVDPSLHGAFFGREIRRDARRVRPNV
jgi:hypothetical protein